MVAGPLHSGVEIQLPHFLKNIQTVESLKDIKAGSPSATEKVSNMFSYLHSSRFSLLLSSSSPRLSNFVFLFTFHIYFLPSRSKSLISPKHSNQAGLWPSQFSSYHYASARNAASPVRLRETPSSEEKEGEHSVTPGRFPACISGRGIFVCQPQCALCPVPGIECGNVHV